MDGPWRIQLLGGLTACRNGQVVKRFQSRKAGALLAYLAFHAGRTCGREELLERIWPETDLDRGRHRLRQALSTLRRQLEPPGVPSGSVIQATHAFVSLNPVHVQTDVAAFKAAIHAAQRADDTERQLQQLRQAIELYRGDLLPDLYDDWVIVERERLADVFLALLRHVIARLEASGKRELSLDYALRALRAAPGREAAHYQVMRLLAEMGRPGQALRHYDLLAATIWQAEGRVPSEAARRLADKLRAAGHRPAQRFSSGTSPIRMPHRSGRRAGRPAPEAATSNSDAHTPPAPFDPPLGTGTERFHLPVRWTRFFGREAEFTQLAERLAPNAQTNGRADTSERSRLLTLLGPGGVGKTRLAVELAHHMADCYGGRVYFVSLASVTDVNQLYDAIADAIPGARAVRGDAVQQIVSAIGSAPALLVLDNVEHLADAGAVRIESLLNRLAPVRTLVTSRQALALAGEQLLLLGPLPVPTRPGTPERLLEFASVQLFVDRAQAVCPEFQITSGNAAAVAAVCERLEGIPLALELAASRSQVMTPARLLTALADRFGLLVNRRRNIESRHQTLRETVEWSYALLDAAQQRFFAQLAVFHGSFSLDATMNVCGCGPDAGRVLNLLEDLIQRSLVVSEEWEDERRFRLLETLRDYAAERLGRLDGTAGEPGERKTLEEQHAAYYLRLALDAEPLFRGSGAARGRRYLRPETGNLRATLTHLIGTSAGVRLAGGLWRFWDAEGYAEEGRRGLEAALQSCPDADPDARIKALNGLAVFTQHLGDTVATERALEEARWLSHRTHDIAGLAETWNNQAVFAHAQGHTSTARRLYRHSLRLWRAVDDVWAIAGTLNNLARVAQEHGEAAVAYAWYREALSRYRALGDSLLAGLVHTNLGALAHDQGDYLAARVAYEHSIRLFREGDDRWHLAVAYHNLGDVLLRLGDPTAAQPHLLESLRLRQSLEQRPGVLLTLTSLASVAAQRGDPDRATRLLGAVHSLQAQFSAPLSAVARREFDAEVARLRNRLSAPDFIAAWTYGQDLTYEEAVALALGIDVHTGRNSDAMDAGAATNTTPSNTPKI